MASAAKAARTPRKVLRSLRMAMPTAAICSRTMLPRAGIGCSAIEVGVVAVMSRSPSSPVVDGIGRRRRAEQRERGVDERHRRGLAHGPLRGAELLDDRGLLAPRGPLHLA